MRLKGAAWKKRRWYESDRSSVAKKSVGADGDAARSDNIIVTAEESDPETNWMVEYLDDEPELVCSNSTGIEKEAETAGEKSLQEPASFGVMQVSLDEGNDASKTSEGSHTEATAQSEEQNNSADDSFVSAGDIEMAEEEFYVDKVVGKRTVNGVVQYKVRWKGYDDENDDTWEPLENLTDAMHLVNAFEKLISADAENSETAAFSGRRTANSCVSSEKQVSAEKKVEREGLVDNEKEDDLRTAEGKKASTGMKRRSSGTKHSYRVSKGEKIRKIVGIQKPGLDGKLRAVIQFLDRTFETIPTEVLARHEPVKLVRFYEQHLQFRDEVD